jgi:hypothetical protein
MRAPKSRRATLATACLLACALAAAHAAAAGGGLSVTPGIFSHAAQRGGLGAVQIANTGRKPLKVTLAARPWIQSPSGSVSPNRRKRLGKVRLHPSSFKLAAGATRSVGLSLSASPPRGSIYGALETTGTPKLHGGGHSGVRVAYRLVTSLRLYPRPGAQKLRAKAGRLIEHGSTRHGALLLAVKNTGNTIVPTGGTVEIRGKGHSLSANATAKAIVPGATVNLPLTRLRGTLPSGRYNITVHLTQGGHGIGKVKRKGVLLR